MSWLRIDRFRATSDNKCTPVGAERRGRTKLRGFESLESRRMLHGDDPHDEDPLPQAAVPNNPPATPVITEPLLQNQVVNAEDVHMEAPVYSDPEGDAHFSTDWEIWTVSPSQRVWSTLNIQGIEKLHTHLGDGIFEGSHAGRTSLLTDTNYLLKVRFRDSTGAVSEYGLRNFQTGSPSTIFPLELKDVLSSPAPTWKSTAGSNIVLPAGTTPAILTIGDVSGNILLSMQGTAGGNQITNPAILSVHAKVRIRIDAGSSPLALPESDIVFTDDQGQSRTLSLPGLSLAVGQSAYYWVGEDGSTYNGTAAQTTPDFSSLARGAAVPYVVRQPGYVVEIVSSGYQLPVNIAFVPNPGSGPNDPYYYVTELYGTIKVVTKSGTVSDYATNLLNFNPTGNFPGSGEQGLSGVVVDPATGDLFVSLLYSATPGVEAAPHYPKVVRIHSNDGGLTAATQTTILDMPGETMGQSHFISNVSFGPDGKLYVHVGDGFDAPTALNLDSYRGKVLRMNLNGTAPSDNPFYNAANGINSRDYIYAYGLRNPFGGAWRASDGQHYSVENGPNVDRFAKITRGTSYGWNGSDASMAINAIYNWNPAHAPVNIAFIQSSTFAGSQFPTSKYDHAFVSESGPTWGTGPQDRGKQITEFVLDANGNLVSGPTDLIEYYGSGKGSVVALAAGPDGLYFTDFYVDQGYESPIDRGSHVLRVKYVGVGDFTTDVRTGTPGFTATFTDTSSVPSPTAWLWDFGDGTTSSLQNPSHVYTTVGTYNVRLQITGANGVVTVEKPNWISVISSTTGLKGEYFDNVDLTNLKLTRTDAQINNDWGNGSPDVTIGAETFSVRWTGFIQPQFSQTYTFYTLSDDGIRLWINNQLVINNWTNHGATENSGTIALVAGQKYDFKLEFYDSTVLATAKLSWSSASQPKQIVPASAFSQVGNPPPPGGAGLTAQYYDNADLTNLKVTRTDTQINNDWANGSPDVTIAVDTFSARWIGFVQPQFSETYTFYTQSDDGVRLWVNDQLIIDNWTDHGLAEDSGSIALVAGQKYAIRMEYYDSAVLAVAKLSWSSPSVAKQIVPASAFFLEDDDPPPPPPPTGSGLTAEYFDNADLTNLKLTRTDTQINNNWAGGSPDATIGADTFSIRWTGQVLASFTETYTFYTQSDDGVRLWVNDQLLVNNWTNHASVENSGTISLVAGQQYSIKMEYYESVFAAVAKLSWSSPSTAKQVIPASAFFLPTAPPPTTSIPGLKTEIFNNADLTSLVLTRTDAQINNDFGTAAPDPTVGADTFSIRWTGQIQPAFSQTYTFYTQSDDGVRLYVNNQLIINNWTDHASTENSGTIVLVAGQKYDLKMEYYDGYVSAVAKLSWSSTSQPKQIVPASALSQLVPSASEVPNDPGFAAADANYSGVVDAGDYTLWSDNYLQSTSDGYVLPGDFNWDGIIGAADYTMWADSYLLEGPPSAASNPAAATVPTAVSTIAPVGSAPLVGVLAIDSNQSISVDLARLRESLAARRAAAFDAIWSSSERGEQFVEELSESLLRQRIRRRQ